MKLSINWLKQYMDCDGLSAQDIAHGATFAGLEVEGIDYIASGTNLVVGEVLECVNHPDSDHLHVCKVSIGEEILNIVCGAPNCTANIKVIVARVGAVLPEITIKESKVRGVVSQGMLCSLKELGVSEKHLTKEQLEGIEILSDDMVVGSENVLELLHLDDIVLDVSLTPNRADCNAMWSLAKEMGAIFNRCVSLPEEIDYSNGLPTKLVIDSKTDNCRHFLGKVIRSLTVKQSPDWLIHHLHAYGIKTINNVVDISNYVMVETGQPLHFYDLAKMEHEEITVVEGKSGVLKALDGFDYSMNDSDLIITTNGVGVGIAGIMGGDESKIDESTTGIIIEAAHFSPVSIRNTSKRLGLSTEAAMRFMKGLDVQAQRKAMNRAVELLVKYADATIIEETVEYGSVSDELKVVSETVEHCNELLGTTFTLEEIVDVFKRLDFNPVVCGTTITCTIPSYRNDICIREDLVEEVIRLLGYERLQTTLPLLEASEGKLSPVQKLRRMTKDVFLGVGCSEIVTYTLVKDSFIQNPLLAHGDEIALASPMSEDRKYIRNQLLPSMLECLSYNQARKAENVNVFEMSNVYSENHVEERLGVLLSGSLQKSRLQEISIPSDFYTLKGLLMSWLEKCGFDEKRIFIKPNTLDTEMFHPYRSAVIYLQKECLGIFGEIHPTVVKSYDCSPCVYAEIKFETLKNQKASKIKFKPLDKYPHVTRDIALVVEEDVSAQSIIDVINQQGKALVKNVEVFDVYQGEHVETGYKSMAISIIYQSVDHTLQENEIKLEHQGILDALEKKCSAKLRG